MVDDLIKTILTLTLKDNNLSLLEGEPYFNDCASLGFQDIESEYGEYFYIDKYIKNTNTCYELRFKDNLLKGTTSRLFLIRNKKND